MAPIIVTAGSELDITSFLVTSSIIVKLTTAVLFTFALEDSSASISP
jgi:hypothetical protein